MVLTALPSQYKKLRFPFRVPPANVLGRDAEA
jgi:hypothetical protein